MCLAIPGRLVSISNTSPDASPLSRTGRVDFSGAVRDVSLAYVPDAQLGDYVVVHVGFAISKLDEEEAQQVLAYLAEIQQLGVPAESAA